jgi:hypothetical protein
LGQLLPSEGRELTRGNEPLGVQDGLIRRIAITCQPVGSAPILLDKPRKFLQMMIQCSRLEFEFLDERRVGLRTGLSDKSNYLAPCWTADRAQDSLESLIGQVCHHSEWLALLVVVEALSSIRMKRG